jgi:hypothetical protein
MSFTGKNAEKLCIDLYCGLGGWAEGFVSEGWSVVGFDIERHCYGQHRYPAQLVLQDVLTLHGSQFRDAACIVASPPCQRYSYMAMPFSRGKREASWQRWLRDSPFSTGYDLNDLFNACFRIQREASEAAGRRIPLVVENVKGAQLWVGRAKANFGSYYLWGDVESVGGRIVASGALRFGMASVKAARRVKVDGFNFHQHENGGPGGSFQSAAVAGCKTVGHANQRDGFSHTRHLTNQRESDALKTEGIKQHGSGPEWFDNGIAAHSSKSDSRKAASALIAKIPLELAGYIARVFKP